jgi:YD repeat-containing protein
MAVYGGQLRAEFGYDSGGRPVSVKYPSGDSLYVKYDAADRPNELWKTMPAPDPGTSCRPAPAMTGAGG